ncbi:MAG: site-2 protease family protein [Candidatus Beckwithbacteria bacterium]
MAIVTFLIILSVLILVHELGHFFLARKFKIKVEEFGFGYPPRLIGFKKKGIVWSLNLLPFGAFVRMLGEDSGEQVKDKKDLKQAFFTQAKLARTWVLLAGVGMNFLLGVVLFAAIYTKIGIPGKVDYLVITQVAEGSPAQMAGLQPEDKISGFNTSESFIEFINQHRGEVITLKLRDGREVQATPRLAEATPPGQGSLGVAISNIDTVQYPLWQRPFRGMWVGLKEALAWGREILGSLGRLVINLAKGQTPQDVAGPVGIYQISKTVSTKGFLAILQFVAILSINLSILNLLPLPALDGGRLMFILIEAIARKRVKPQVEQAIHLVGIVALISLMILVTINDVKRLIG